MLSSKAMDLLCASLIWMYMCTLGYSPFASFCYPLLYIFHIANSMLWNVSTNCTDGDIKLYSSGVSSSEGLLLICINMAWTSVCYNSYWSTLNTRVTCGQLHYSVYGMCVHVHVHEYIYMSNSIQWTLL